MRILIVPIDVPLPALSGGRIDVWRRMQALHKAGAELGMLCWYDAYRDGAPDQARMAELNGLVSTVRMMPITRNRFELAARLMNIWRWPSHVASRWVTTNKAETLAWARKFKPDVVLLDGLYGGAVAQWLASALRVPLVYRSHNIEHLYMRRLYRIERSWKHRLGLAANLLGLKRFEDSVQRQASIVLDISLDDIAWWRARGMSRLQWLPTSVDDLFASKLATPVERDIDVLYFGNLHTPNNVDAIRWLLTDIAGKLMSQGVRLTIAGSKPSPEVRQLVRDLAGTTLIESPDDMAAVVRRAKVLVNPVRFGSGVNLKSVEMLFSSASLVSTSVGVQGLPALVKGCFVVSDDTDGFAKAINHALGHSQMIAPERLQARALFNGNQSYELIAQACGKSPRLLNESASVHHG